MKVAAKLFGVVVGLLLLSAGVAAPTSKIDRSPPTAPQIAGPRTTSSTKPVYTFAATDRQTPRSRLRYRCGVDTRRLHVCAARFSKRLSRGRHTLRAQAVDRAGNQSRVTSITVEVSGTTGNGPGRGRGRGRPPPPPPPPPQPPPPPPAPPPPPPPPPPACTAYLNPGGNLGSFLAGLPSGAIGCLHAGSYTGNFAIALGNRTLRSAPGERATINGYIWVTSTANSLTLEDLNVDGTSSSSTFAISVHGDDVTLAGLDVTNRKTGGVNAICILVGEGFEQNPLNTAWRLRVDHVRAHHCGDDNHEHGIYMESTRDALIVDSWFYANPGMGIDFYPDAQRTLVDHVLIDGNSMAVKENLGFSGEQAGVEYANSYASSHNVVTNSLITNAFARYNVDAFYPASYPLPVGNEVRFSCVWNAPSGNFGHDRAGDYAEHDNLNLAPLYVDRASYNFTLGAGSPCAGKGPR